MRVIIGLIKGGLIGGGLGFGFMQLGSTIGSSRVMSYLLYGVIGALVGFIAGRPFWRHETIWTPVIKAIFGAALCAGLYWVVTGPVGDPSLAFAGLDTTISGLPYVLGAGLGIIYGVFVEIDDGGKKEPKVAAKTGG